MSAAGSPLDAATAAEVTRQIGTLAGAGLPLGPGLRALGADLDDTRLRRLLDALADDLDAGTPLAEAIAARGDAFPPYLRGLLAAGERSGRLPQLLAEVMADHRVGDTIRRGLWLNLFYPAALLLGCVFLFLALAATSSGGIVSVYRDFGINVPAITQVVLTLIEALQGVGVWVLLGPLLVTVILFVLARVLFTPVERCRFVNAIPGYGPLNRWISAAEFCRVLALLVDSGLPLPEALPLAGDSARDPVLAEATGAAVTAIQAGRPLTEALATGRVLPEGLAPFLSWAESGRSLPESLRLAAGIFEARAQAQARFLAVLLQATTLAGVLWWLAIAVVALLWPLLSLISKLAG